MGWYSYDDWPPYVSVAQRRRQATQKLAKIKKTGRKVFPVDIVGRKIAATFWGDAWCKNLESYSDYSNRLPRGRTYVRNGSVIDLQIEAGCVRGLVSGSDLYEVDVQIKRLAKKRWTDIKRQCAGKIDSLVELLQGSISKGVMEIVTHKGEGLFPAPRQIVLSCSCPDWAIMCKHVAATLYGVGARLDHEPELLFTLRGVDAADMVEAAVDRTPTDGKARKGRALAADELSSVFGVDIDMGVVPAQDVTAQAKGKRRAAQAKKKAKPKSTPKKPVSKKPPRKRKSTIKKATAKKTTGRKPAAKRVKKKAVPKEVSRRTTKYAAWRSSK